MAWNFKKNSGWKSGFGSKNWTAGVDATNWKEMPTDRNWASSEDRISAPHFKKKNASHWNESEDGPWEFEASDADYYYDEGDITTSKFDETWRVHPTGPTDREIHDPCGYWYKELCLSSTIYPLEDFEYVESVEHEIIGGVFRIGIHYYTGLPEDVETTGHEILSGVFSTKLHEYEIPEEELETTAHEIISGVYRQALHEYEIDVEEVETTGHTVISGVYRTALIEYKNWPEESLETKGAAVIGGTYGS